MWVVCLWLNNKKFCVVSGVIFLKTTDPAHWRVMSIKSVCIICHEGASATLIFVSNPSMLQELMNWCKERMALGQTNLKTIADRLESLKETAQASVQYYSESRKPIVNKAKTGRLRTKTTYLASPGCSRRGPGCPSSEVDSRPKRTKTVLKAKEDKGCMFNACLFMQILFQWRSRSSASCLLR